MACLSHISYHGVLLWNETRIDWLSLSISFGTFSCLGTRMRTRGLVCPLFVEAKWVRNGVEDHEVRDGNDVQVGFRLVKAPMWVIKSPL